tara:strand:+ start:216 stop:881 length:666 start_codon:yes stop_codon:yes gene_type:complete
MNVVFEDLPGFGERNQQSSPSSIEKIAELLAPRLESLYKEVGHKIHLLGISMGGMVALALAERYPHYCESLVMINSSVKPISSFYERLQPIAYPAFVKAWFHPFKLQSEREILNISTARYKNDAQVLARWLDLREQAPPSRMAVLKQMLAASSFRAPVQAPIKKLLLIASQKDRVVSCSCSLKLAKFWNVPVLVHYQAGHDLALDDPLWLAGQLFNYYSKN